MSRLLVRELFATVQGEGSEVGKPSVFVRLAGCNLWSGHAAGRAAGAGSCALWCDTQFVGGDRLEPAQVLEQVLAAADGWACPHVTITGGEPGLQLQRPAGEQLVQLLHDAGVAVAVETNGTVQCDVLDPDRVHVTCSPKVLRAQPDSLQHVVLTACTDLKVVVPQWPEHVLRRLVEQVAHRHLYLQPLDDGTGPLTHLQAAREAAQLLGGSVSVQTHKLTGMP